MLKIDYSATAGRFMWHSGGIRFINLALWLVN